MKSTFLIFLFSILFLNASLFSFYQETNQEFILTEKPNTSKKKKPEKEDNKSEKDNPDSKADEKDSESLKDKIKEKFKKDKEKREGGRFGDKRF